MTRGFILFALIVISSPAPATDWKAKYYRSTSLPSEELMLANLIDKNDDYWIRLTKQQRGIPTPDNVILLGTVPESDSRYTLYYCYIVTLPTCLTETLTHTNQNYWIFENDHSIKPLYTHAELKAQKTRRITAADRRRAQKQKGGKDNNWRPILPPPRQ